MASLLLPVPVYHNPVWDLSPIQEKRTITHYSNVQTILLVGEGDFSFSSALASAFGSAVNIMATSLDSLDEVLAKYQWANMTLWNLYQRGAFILHNVDATRVAVHPVIRSYRFDTIVWNLPHAGFFGKAESDETVIKKHQTLLKSFFSNASILLRDDGEVHVSHQSHGPYKKWEVESLAHLSGLKLKESVPFHPGMYPGYQNRRGVGKCASDSFALGTSKTYKFVHRCSTPLSPGESSDAKKLGDKKESNMLVYTNSKLKKRAEQKLHAQKNQPQVRGTLASSGTECIATGESSDGKKFGEKKKSNILVYAQGGEIPIMASPSPENVDPDKNPTKNLVQQQTKKPLNVGRIPTMASSSPAEVENKPLKLWQEKKKSLQVEGGIQSSRSFSQSERENQIRPYQLSDGYEFENDRCHIL